jgi:hypothetical protein
VKVLINVNYADGVDLVDLWNDWRHLGIGVLDLTAITWDTGGRTLDLEVALAAPSLPATRQLITWLHQNGYDGAWTEVR